MWQLVARRFFYRSIAQPCLSSVLQTQLPGHLPDIIVSSVAVIQCTVCWCFNEVVDDLHSLNVRCSFEFFFDLVRINHSFFYLYVVFNTSL